MGEEWGAERGTQVNRIMKQTLGQMNMRGRALQIKMNQLPVGEKRVPQPRKTRSRISVLFYVVKDASICLLPYFSLLLRCKVTFPCPFRVY